MAKFTKKAIISTFFKLLENNSLSQITVKKITDICEINHNTFYYYFSDIYQIIDEVFDTELDKVKKATFSSGSLNDACIYAMDFVRKNKQAIRNIYNSVSSCQLLRYLDQVIEEVINDYAENCLKNLKVSEENKHLILQYHKCAMLGGILIWLENGEDKELEFMLKRFSNVTEQNIANYICKTSEILK